MKTVTCEPELFFRGRIPSNRMFVLATEQEETGDKKHEIYMPNEKHELFCTCWLRGSYWQLGLARPQSEWVDIIVEYRLLPVGGCGI